MGAYDAFAPKVRPVLVLTEVKRPVLFSLHPGYHLTHPGPAGSKIMPSLMILGHRVPHQRLKDGCRNARCWNGHKLDKCLSHVQGASRHSADLEKDQLLLVSFEEGERTYVAFNLVAFVYEPTHYGNLIFEPYKNSGIWRNAPPPAHLRGFWTSESTVPLFKPDGGLVDSVSMIFYKESTPVAKSTDWDGCTHKKWHQQLVSYGVATKF